MHLYLTSSLRTLTKQEPFKIKHGTNCELFSATFLSKSNVHIYDHEKT